MEDIVPAHLETVTIVEEIEIPSHARRGAESALFRANVKRLKADGHGRCWISGSTDELEAHHILEWCLWPDINPEKMRETLMLFDPYGYSRSPEFDGVPITSPDDLRNLLIIAKPFHTEKFRGVHMCAFPAWIAQRVVKEGAEVIPPPTRKTARRHRTKKITLKEESHD